MTITVKVSNTAPSEHCPPINYTFNLWGGQRAAWEAVVGRANAGEVDRQATRLTLVADGGDYVKQGQLLVRLDPSDTIVAQENAEANLARVVLQVHGMYSNVDNYKAMVAARKVELQRARTDYQRTPDWRATAPSRRRSCPMPVMP